MIGMIGKLTKIIINILVPSIEITIITFEAMVKKILKLQKLRKW